MRKIIVFSIALLMLQSCVSLFSSKDSTVKITTATEGASIYNKSVLLGKGTITKKFLKRDVSQELTLKKEGYMDKTFAFNVQKKNPLRFANIISIPTIYGAYIVYGIDGITPKKYQYNKEVRVPAMVKEPLKRAESQKYLQINNAAMNLKKEDTILIKYKNEKNFLAHKIQSVENSKDDIKYDETVYNTTLTKFLKKYNYIDTTESIFPNYNNTSYIESIIDKVTFHSIGSASGSWDGAVVYAESKIKWIILDYYRVKLDSITITTNSDLFKIYSSVEGDKKKDDEAETSGLIKALNSVVEKSMVELLANEKFKKLTKKTQDNSSYTALKMRCDRYDTKSLNDLIQASVTIKTGKNSHGSGFLISSDGYIVTNYHVVANSTKKVSVILNNGAKYEATIERTAPMCDLALLKVEANMLPHMQIKNYEVKDIQLGSEVATIGTPKSVELGQSVAKGIISGTRTPYENMSYIQTNIAVNPGNSGGAFLDDKGNVIGVVSSKLVGFGVEGIAFAIPSKYIFDSLKIKY